MRQRLDGPGKKRRQHGKGYWGHDNEGKGRNDNSKEFWGVAMQDLGMWRCKIWAVEGEATAKEGEIGRHGKQEGMGLEL